MRPKFIRFDWAMKKLLRSKANFSILEGFLSELLKEDIKIKSILESEGNKEYKVDKSNRVDLLVENTKKELLIIEIQNEKEWDYISRILYGTSKVVTEYINEGEPYKKIKKIISISIIYFDLGQGKDYVYKGTTKFIGMHDHKELELSAKQKEIYKKEKLEEIYPEYYLLKINNFNNIAKDSLDEWIYFFKNEDIKENFEAKGIKEAKKKLNIMKLKDNERKEYDVYLDDLHYQASLADTAKIELKFARRDGLAEGRKEGIKKGREEGREEGIKIEKIKIAKKLLEIGTDVKTIEAATGLTEKEINKIK